MRTAFKGLLSASALFIAACSAQAEVIQLSPVEANAKAQAGEILIVDVRTPGEWRDTGVAKGAELVTLQDPNFAAKVLALMEQNPGKDVAFICRTGNRSMAAARMLDKKTEAPIYNIQEGMVGRTSADGWIARDLPHEDWGR